MNPMIDLLDEVTKAYEKLGKQDYEIKRLKAENDHLRRTLGIPADSRIHVASPHLSVVR